MALPRPPTAGTRPGTGQTSSNKSVASTVYTGAWVEYKQYPDPLHTACEHGDLEAVIELLDGEGATYLQKKLGRHRDINALATVEGNRAGWTLLFYAAAGGQPDIIKYLIENGADAMRVDQFKQTCVAYAKGSQARQIIRGEQLKVTKTAETLAAIDDAHRRLGEIDDRLAWILGLEEKRCRREDALKRNRDAKLQARKRTPDEDGSDEDRTDETQQVPPDEVDPHRSLSPTQELEKEVNKLFGEEVKAREDLFESLGEARNRTVEASEAWDYVQRLRATYQGKPPNEDVVEEATQTFFNFCIKLEPGPEIDQHALHDTPDADALPEAAVDSGEAVLQPMNVEEQEQGDGDISFFDAGEEKQMMQSVWEGDEAIAMDAVSEGAGQGQRDAAMMKREMGLEGLLGAAKSFEGIEWEEAAAERFLEKYAHEDDHQEVLMLEEFLRGFEDLRMKMRIVRLKMLVDQALEQQGAREMALAGDLLKQQIFEHALVAADRGDKCYKQMSNAVVDRLSRTGEMISRSEVVAFRELVPEVQSKAVCRTQFIESLNKCNNALSDVAVMSQSYFKRPWAANRLNTAREALKDATTNFAECCPPPMVGMAKMKMLLDRRARTGTGSTSISIFCANAPSRGQNHGGRLGTTDLLTLPEDGESRPPTGESNWNARSTPMLSDRTQAEVASLVLEGQALLDQLPDDMTAALTDAIEDGGSPVAVMLRNQLPKHPESVVTIDPARVQGLEELENEGAELVASLSDELAQAVVASVIQSTSPVADAVRRSSSPVAEILRVQSPHMTPPVTGSTAIRSAPETPGYIAPHYSGPSNLACLPGEPVPQGGQKQEIDFGTLQEMLSLCGIIDESETRLRDVVLAVKDDMAFMPKKDLTPDRQEQEKIVSEDAHAQEAEDGKVVDYSTMPNTSDMYGLGEHGPEAELLPAVYDRLHSQGWEQESKANLDKAKKRMEELAEQLKYYTRAKDTFEDATEEFDDGAYTDAERKAKDADKLFAQSATHDHKLLCQELMTRSKRANIGTLKDLAYESLRKSVELTSEFQFDEAREVVEEAHEALKKLEAIEKEMRPVSRGLERAANQSGASETASTSQEVEQALEHVNSAEEAFFYEKLVKDLTEVFKHADRTMHDRHFYDAYQTYQTVVQTAEEFAQAFPGSARGCELVGYLHVRRAIALSCHGNDMGEESGRKWHAQALEAARRSRKLAPQIPDAILYEGIALIGMSQNAEAIDVLQAALTDASGLKWQRIDTSRPDEGQELTDSKLSEALMSKTEFNHKEWEAFGIQDLRKDDFIKSGDTYFKPRDYACFKPGSGHERKLTMLLALALAKEDEENAARLARTASRASKLSSQGNMPQLPSDASCLPTVPGAFIPLASVPSVKEEDISSTQMLPKLIRRG